MPCLRGHFRGTGGTSEVPPDFKAPPFELFAWHVELFNRAFDLFTRRLTLLLEAPDSEVRC